MNRSLLARAMTKHTFSLGAPLTLVAPCYAIPVFLFMLVRTLWILIPVGFGIHMWMKLKFRRDEYWLANYFDALMEEQNLEP